MSKFPWVHIYSQQQKSCLYESILACAIRGNSVWFAYGSNLCCYRRNKFVILTSKIFWLLQIIKYCNLKKMNFRFWGRWNFAFWSRRNFDFGNSDSTVFGHCTIAKIGITTIKFEVVRVRKSWWCSWNRICVAAIKFNQNFNITSKIKICSRIEKS